MDIVVHDVTMRFRRAGEEAASLKEAVIRRIRRRDRYETFTALDHVSFTVGEGEVAGEKRIREMIHGGSTVLMVSHSMAVIRQNCTKAIWLEKGKLRMAGAPDRVCASYEGMRDGGTG